ncbi:MAG: DUF4332 domain-containing protein [Hyphomicrobiaceae bacterium]|nr:DUF4332 domain-containing protein [Hyphomicrobiaceae bacterium]
MSLLFRILYAAHANGTHHKLALDALQRLKHPQGELWQRLFLKHAALYLEGSKDPDNKFKDFKNHVLHVRDNYWGGAPEKVQNWYQHLVSALTAQNWSEAVYAAGVLSHYYTDPIHPFHTGQTEAENNIHRAVEWSINRSYDALRKQGEQSFGTLSVAVPAGDAWLREMTLNGAEFSNRSYEKLIAHYDISRGVVDPPSGLDSVGRTLVAELLMYASAGFARILDRAFEASGQTPPAVSLTVDTVLASLQIPMKTLQKRLSNAADRELVQRMYDELKATGTVDKTLPQDDRSVRDLFAAEVLAPRAAAAAVARTARLTQEPAAPQLRVRPVAALVAEPPALAHGTSVGAKVHAKVRADVEPDLSHAEPISISNAAAIEALEQAVLAAANDDINIVDEDLMADAGPVADAAPAPADDVPLTPQLVPEPALAQDPTRSAPHEPAPEQDVPVLTAPVHLVAADERTVKVYLALGDDVERAPSIGAKTARRLGTVGVTTVADFLEEDADQLATMLGQRSISGRLLKDWQDQARLVMDVPGLRGTHAQLLVGAGYRTAEAVAEADADTLCAAIVKFATTREGQSVLRDGDTPDISKIKGWIGFAERAIAA